MHRILTLLTAFLLATSCSYNRVTIRPVPEKDAPLTERVKALKDLQPESGLSTSYFKNGVYQGTYLNSVMLGDGTRVEDPRDLLPAVEIESPTANYAFSFEEKVGTARTWSIVGWSVFAAGLATMFIPLAISGVSDTNALLIGLGVGGGIDLLSMIPILVSASYAGRAQEDRISAFQSYPKALQKRLELEEEIAAQKEESRPRKLHFKPTVDRPERASLLLR